MKSAQCETCRRPLGVEQLGCPRRNLGEENLCPYQVEESRLPSADWGFMFFVGLGISLIPLMAILIGESLPLWISAVLLPFMLFGLVIMGIGLYSLFGRQKIIFNPDTGQAWQQTRILGIPVGQTVTSAIETIPWQGGPARGLRYPASVAELCRGGKAAQLITAAVLQMLAQGVIMLGEVGCTGKDCGCGI